MTVAMALSPLLGPRQLNGHALGDCASVPDPLGQRIEVGQHKLRQLSPFRSVLNGRALRAMCMFASRVADVLAPIGKVRRQMATRSQAPQAVGKPFMPFCGGILGIHISGRDIDYATVAGDSQTERTGHSSRFGLSHRMRDIVGHSCGNVRPGRAGPHFEKLGQFRQVSVKRTRLSLGPSIHKIFFSCRNIYRDGTPARFGITNSHTGKYGTVSRLSPTWALQCLGNHWNIEFHLLCSAVRAIQDNKCHV